MLLTSTITMITMEPKQKDRTASILVAEGKPMVALTLAADTISMDDQQLKILLLQQIKSRWTIYLLSFLLIQIGTTVQRVLIISQQAEAITLLILLVVLAVPQAKHIRQMRRIRRLLMTFLMFLQVAQVHQVSHLLK